MAVACGDPNQDPNEVMEQMEEGPVDGQLAAAIEGSLSAFVNDPARFLNTLPAKFTPTVSLFSEEAIGAKAFVDAKHNDKFVVRRDPDAAKTDAWQSHDWARNLVDDYRHTKLSDMYRLKRATLAESPWSDDYWPLYAGSLAKRYADPNLPSSNDWKAITDYLKSRQPANPDLLSPAEKYDLLIGLDPKSPSSLTTYNLNTGKGYYEMYGKVETWMGICHGWAPAAYMVPRPQKAIEVLAADGRTKIKFYPADIKALASLLWANARAPMRFIGGRCNTKMPQTDEIGRIKDATCRDTNAGTWHLAVVNQLGVAKRSMILDATFDYEVWNQPVYAYDYVYFNPKTNKTTSYLSEAKVAVSSFPEDKFKAYRAPGTTHIVGIAMNVKWVVETRPSHAPTDSPSRDAISGARYLYTLELDKDGNIIGGEWMQNAHPDFLWTPTPSAQALSYHEAQATGTWDGVSTVPASWRTAAARSAPYGQPLAAIVNRLAQLARQ